MRILPARPRAGRPPRGLEPVVCRAAGPGSASAPFGGARRASQPAVDLQRLEQLRELVQEATEIAVATGPRGVARTLQAARALTTLAQQQLAAAAAGRPLDSPPAALRKLFEALGATYIKLGQFIASSPTLFPEPYVLEFQKCLDATPPVPFDVIRKTVESELRLSLEDVFEFVDTTPLACASVAQVHAARLRGGGADVVIKVLKPGVVDTLTTDLNFLYVAARLLEFASPELSRTSLAAVASDIRASMMEEVDFRKEADHLEEFGDFLDRAGLRALATAPRVYRQYSGQRVLVMERLQGGAPLTDLESVRRVAKNAQPEAVLINALNVWFASVVGCQTFHADVHAGNLLALPDGRVGFIDFGIVGRISPATWRGVEALLGATTTGDYLTMARALATIGATGEDVDIPAFARDLEGLFTSLQQIDAQLVVSAGAGGAVSASVAADDQAVTRFLLDLAAVGEARGVRLPREFALLVKQLLYFDRYTRILAPGLQVFGDERVNLKGVDLDFGLVG